ncbi:MAG: polysaccharide biosynthesis/export family protein [Cryomorphaceae bacterium]|nr:polysaccharide biosynthesis/export family protein [Flavobacteriales bacterium]
MRILYLFLILLLVGCGSGRDLVYLSNIEDEDLNKEMLIENVVTPTIQPDDLLSITVNSLSAESNMLFNQGVLGTLGSDVSEGAKGSETIEGYLVDDNGYINFPVVGQVKLGGLTKAEATDTIQSILSRDYIKNPTVNIRFLNFKITVLGEVKNPSVITIPTEKINILEAISMAGDMTVVGKRENVLIIREHDGVRKFIRVNLNDKALVESQEYYLRQNDIVFVEADKYKAAQASLARSNTQFYLSIGVSLATLVVLLDRFNNN